MTIDRLYKSINSTILVSTRYNNIEYNNIYIYKNIRIYNIIEYNRIYIYIIIKNRI